MNFEVLDWTKLQIVGALSDEILPVAVQNADSGEIMVGHVNREALRESFETGRAAFWSTTRNELHRKGDTSGDFLDIVDIRVNCEANSLLYRVRLRSEGVCHTVDETGRTRSSCFYRSLLELAGPS